MLPRPGDSVLARQALVIQRQRDVFGHVEERDQVRAGLRELGYGDGYVTIDTFDFYIDSHLRRSVESGRRPDEAADPRETQNGSQINFHGPHGAISFL